jgi:prepilin-type N-terminal cleavage/methylation domain-containing protein
MKIKQTVCSRRSGARAAFSLTEIIVAMVVITVGAVGLMSCFGYSFSAMQIIRENQRATQIMLEKAETLRLYSWDQVNQNGFIPTTFTANYDGTTNLNSSGGTIYTGRLDISSFPYNTSYRDKMRQLTVSLQWTTKNVTRSRTMTTYLAKDGIQNYVY